MDLLKKNWKTVLIAILAILAVVFGILFIDGNSAKNDVDKQLQDLKASSKKELQAAQDAANDAVTKAQEEAETALTEAVDAAKKEAEEAATKAKEDAEAAQTAAVDAVKKEAEEAAAKAKEEADAALTEAVAAAKKEAEEAAAKATEEAVAAAKKEAEEAVAAAKKEAEEAQAAAVKEAVEAATKEAGEAAVKATEEAVAAVKKEMEEAATKATEEAVAAVKKEAEAAQDKAVKDAVDAAKKEAEKALKTAEDKIAELEKQVKTLEEANAGKDTGDAKTEEAKPEEAKTGEAKAEEPKAEEVKAMTFEEYTAAALESEVCVETCVQATQAWWDNKITVYAQSPDGAYFIYNMTCAQEDAAKLVPGTPIRVKGYKAEWSGETEIVDATFEIIEGKSFKAEPEDVTAKLGTDDLIKSQNKLVAFKGLTVEAYDESGAAFAYKNAENKTDDLYFKVSKDGKTYDFCVEFYLCGQDTEVYKAVEALKVGDVIDAEGFLYWYNGANPHITKVTKAK